MKPRSIPRKSASAIAPTARCSQDPHTGYRCPFRRLLFDCSAVRRAPTSRPPIAEPSERIPSVLLAERLYTPVPPLTIRQAIRCASVACNRRRSCRPSGGSGASRRWIGHRMSATCRDRIVSEPLRIRAHIRHPLGASGDARRQGRHDDSRGIWTWDLTRRPIAGVTTGSRSAPTDSCYKPACRLRVPRDPLTRWERRWHHALCICIPVQRGRQT